MNIAERGRWYFDRLRSMGPAEIAGRIGHLARISRWRFRRSWPAPVAIKSAGGALLWDPVAFLAPEERLALLQEADRCLAGQYTILNLSFTEHPIEWHRDPQTGRVAPMDFSFSVPYREPDRVGNVKNIWEKSRHHHLTVLAIAYRLTGDPRYSSAVASQLLSWVRDNPVMRGVNWASSLELGIRLISWVWIEQLLRESPEHDALFGESGALWPAIYWHQRIIDGHMSVGSSANNHLIGEAAGLYLASVRWPRFAESSQWTVRSKSVLEDQAAAQTFPEGLNRELAFGYHLFVLEFLLLSLGISNGSDRSALRVRDVVGRMLAVLPLVADAGGNLPRYGDEDDGMAVQLRPTGSDRVRWIGAIAKSLGFPEASPEHGSIGFESAGVYVLRSTSKSGRELFCLADAGPLGYLSIAAHGHADALSFSLSYDGVPIVVDPGTYAYHVEPEWRSYFRGTAAHNTLVIDGFDQSTQAGSFLWRTKAHARVLHWQDHPFPSLSAEHDGYARLPGRPIHCRNLSLFNDRLEIRDQVIGAGEHDLEWRFHLFPERDATVQEGKCTIPLNRAGAPIHARFAVNLDPRLQWEVRRGAPNAGWYSAGFNRLEPASVLIGRARLALPLEVSFQIILECE